MKRLLLPLAAALIIISGGCSLIFQSGRVDFDDMEQQTYGSASGYSIQLPADWELLSEDEDSSSFISADHGLALTVGSELGGIEYYSLTEIGDMLSEQLTAELFSQAEPEPAHTGERVYQRLISGSDSEGGEIAAALYVFEPYTAVRYYLLFLLDSAEYPAWSNAIEDMAGSFVMTMDADSVYQLMRERDEAEQAAEEETVEEVKEETEEM